MKRNAIPRLPLSRRVRIHNRASCLVPTIALRYPFTEVAATFTTADRRGFNLDSDQTVGRFRIGSIQDHDLFVAQHLNRSHDTTLVGALVASYATLDQYGESNIGSLL